MPSKRNVMSPYTTNNQLRHFFGSSPMYIEVAAIIAKKTKLFNANFAMSNPYLPIGFVVEYLSKFSVAG
jgi:hypothetical protein